MQFDEVIRARRSIREYQPDAVPDDCIDQILEAVRLAPSGLNIQPWRFVVIRGADAMARLAEATPSRFIAKAPAAIVCCADREAFSAAGERYRGLLSDPAVVAEQLTISSSIAVTYLLLKAVDLGLGGCWIGVFDEAKVKAVAGIGDRHAVKALAPIGYPARNPAPSPRLPVDALILNRIG